MNEHDKPLDPRAHVQHELVIDRVIATLAAERFDEYELNVLKRALNFAYHSGSFDWDDREVLKDGGMMLAEALTKREELDRADEEAVANYPRNDA